MGESSLLFLGARVLRALGSIIYPLTDPRSDGHHLIPPGDFAL